MGFIGSVSLIQDEEVGLLTIKLALNIESLHIYIYQ